MQQHVTILFLPKVGAKSLGEETLKLIVDEWLTTEFEGGRHQKRLDKISEIENI